MIRIDGAVVRKGSLVLSHLPFQDGQRVSVMIDDAEESGTQDRILPRRTIQEVRQLLGGGVARFDDPFEPMIPPDSWEALK